MACPGSEAAGHSGEETMRTIKDMAPRYCDRHPDRFSGRSGRCRAIDRAEHGDANPPNCLKYDAIRPRGSTTPWPPVCATVSPELGGYREELFRNGWNIRGYLTFGALYDIGKKNSQDFESYPGQRAMLYGSAWLSFLYDLGRLGMNDGSVLRWISIPARQAGTITCRPNPVSASFRSLPPLPMTGPS